MKHLPNFLTLFRVLLVPAVVATLLIKFDEREWVAVGIVVLAALTDWLDGYLARRNNWVTDIGKLLDPVADKMLSAGILISLVQLQAVPAWMAVILIGREFAVSGLRMIALTKQLVIPAGRLGKLKTIFETPTFICLILRETLPAPWGMVLGAGGLWVVLTLSIVSGFYYFSRAWKKLDFTSTENI